MAVSHLFQLGHHAENFVFSILISATNFQIFFLTGLELLYIHAFYILHLPLQARVAFNPAYYNYGVCWFGAGDIQGTCLHCFFPFAVGKFSLSPWNGSTCFCLEEVMQIRWTYVSESRSVSQNDSLLRAKMVYSVLLPWWFSRWVIFASSQYLGVVGEWQEQRWMLWWKQEIR